MFVACRRYFQRELSRGSCWRKGLCGYIQSPNVVGSFAVTLAWSPATQKASELVRNVQDQLGLTLKGVSRIGSWWCRTKFRSTIYSTRMSAQGSSLFLQHRVARTALSFSEASGLWNGVTLQRRSQAHTVQMHLKGSCNVQISVLTFNLVDEKLLILNFIAGPLDLLHYMM